MNIIPRDPWFNMDTFFDDLFAHRHLLDKEAPYKPRVDIIEKDDHYLFIAEFPGIDKKDISVNIHNGILTIEAQIEEESTSEADRIIRKERRSGFFSRSINVGDNINPDEIKAEFNNGLLKLTAPKPEHPPKETHKIDIA
jgi:HSP20 family protein